MIKGFRNMRELRCLHVEVVSKVGGGICEYLQDALPDALQTLYWPVYPFCCLPRAFQANNLVNLQMPLSFISQLWEVGERKVLDKLKFIDLSYSKMSILNLGMTPHLEHIELKGCNEFVEIQMPVKSPNLKILNLCGSKLRSLNLGMTSHLEQLYLKGCNEFVELHMPVECPNLKILILSGSRLRNLNLGMTPHLMELDLKGCNEFLELHLPVECQNLKYLNLGGSKLRNLNLRMTTHLRELYLEGCNEFLELHLPVECPNLKYLNLRGSKVTNLNLKMTPHLKKLDLQGCYFLKEIHAPVGCLRKLAYLELSRCLRFEHFLVEKQYISTIATLKLIAKPLNTRPVHPSSSLPKFQFECYYHEPLNSMSGNIEKLISFGLCACTNLESFSASIYSLQHLRKLSLQGWIPEVSKDIWQLESLEKLTLSMKEIKHLPDSICMLKHLKSLHLKSCCLLEELPKDLDRLECLEVLNLEDCTSLRDIPSSTCNMKRLTRLHLPYCILVEKLPEEIGRLECLKCLNLEGAGICSLPQSVFQLKGLCVIGSKWRLESYGFTSLEEVSSLWRRSTASYFVYL